MRRREVLGTFLAAPALMAATAPRTAPGMASLEPVLTPYLASHNLPALAAAVVKRGTIIAASAVGSRMAGARIPVTINDRFHIGSDTKAMTATLAGLFVEQGRLRWDSPVAELFPDLGDGMTEGLRDVTLTQLLSHTSGMPSDNAAFDALLLKAYARQDLRLEELRAWLVREWRTQPLAAKPGSVWAYSNMGYIMVGAALERLSGKSWEALIRTHIFNPLKLRSAGFGPQSTLGLVDAPLPHRHNKDGSLKPMMAGPNADNPLIMGPAGTVHLSILDFATWANWNVAQGRRPPPIVSAATLRHLQTEAAKVPVRPDAPPGTPPTGGYGLGWGTVTVPWAAEPLLFHGGSNEMNLAMIMLRPAHDFAIVMTTNVSGPKADEALKALGAALFHRFD